MCVAPTPSAVRPTGLAPQVKSSRKAEENSQRVEEMGVEVGKLRTENRMLRDRCMQNDRWGQGTEAGNGRAQGPGGRWALGTHSECLEARRHVSGRGAPAPPPAQTGGQTHEPGAFV